VRPASSPPTVPLLLLSAVAFVVIADARVVDPLLPVIADDFGVGIGTAGSVVTAYTLPYGLCQLVYGPLGDRIGRLSVMRVGLAVFAVGTAACALAPGLPLLVLFRFLTGVAAAAMIPLTLAYIGDHYPYGERQATIATYLNAVALGQILGVSLGGSVADFLSWRAIFLAYGILAAALAWIFWRRAGERLDRPAPGPPAQPARLVSLAPYAGLLRDPAARIVIGTVCLEGFFFYGGFVYVGASLRDRFDLPYAAIGAILATYGIGGLIYSRLVRRILGRVGERGLVLIGGMLVCACLLGIAFAGTWAAIVPLVIVTGIGFYAIHGTLQTKATELSPGARGTAVALFAFALFLGQGLGAAALGWVAGTTGYAAVFTTSAVAIAVLAIAFARTLTPRPAS
jgi:predicted MFS family arabinose efflux permease